MGLFILLQIILPAAVYADAASKGISHTKDRSRGLFSNWSAIEWGICCMSTYSFGAIVYIFRRSTLIIADGHQKSYAISISRITFVTVGFILLGALVHIKYICSIVL